MTQSLAARAHALLERRFPERRLFIRSEDHTRFIRLHPATQLAMWGGSALFVGWTIVATAILLMDTVGSGNYREQAQRDQLVYEDRLNALSEERDLRGAEAVAANDRFAAALAQVSVMQGELLSTEQRLSEMETGLAVVHATLRRTVAERDEARAEAVTLAAASAAAPPGSAAADEMADTVSLLTAALADTAAERDGLQADAEEATVLASDLDLELRLMKERNDEIFRQLEDALTISVEPLDDMFRTAGLEPDRLIEQVREGYSGQGGPLTPIEVSTMGASAQDPSALRANRLLDRLDQLNLYRIAVSRVPFAMPLRDPFRYTSGFGARWGRMHEGVDMAGPMGTPVYATADGVVIQAGPAGDYGLFIKIQHEFGIETRYAHLSAVGVEVGQRVSRGDQIGAMGSSGRSTGSHLHYEVRVGGEARNPTIYFGAGQDVL